MSLADQMFDKVKYLAPVRLPKEVIIYNGRVSCVQICLQIVITILLLFSFAFNNSFLTVTQPQMTPSGWRSAMNTTEYTALVSADGTYSGVV